MGKGENAFFNQKYFASTVSFDRRGALPRRVALKSSIAPKTSEPVAAPVGAASGQVGTWAIAMDQKFGWEKYFPPLSLLAFLTALNHTCMNKGKSLKPKHQIPKGLFIKQRRHPDSNWG